MKRYLALMTALILAIAMVADRGLNYRQYSTVDGLPGNTIRSIMQDSKGNIWIGTLNGLARLDSNGFTVYQAGKGEEPSLSDNRIYKLREDNEGHLWISTASRVYNCYDLHQRKFIAYDSVPFSIRESNTETTSSDGVTTILDNLGRKWTYNHTGKLTLHQEDGKKTKSFSLIPPDVLKGIDHERYHILRDGKGSTWISTYGNGLFRLDEKTNRLTHYTSKNGQQGYIPSNYIHYMTKDKEDGIWIATEYSGVTRIWEEDLDFRYVFPSNERTRPRANSVRMVTQTGDGELFIANKAGDLYRWKPEEDTMAFEKSFPAAVYAVLKQKDGTIWYGTRGEGMFIGEENYRHEHNNPYSLPNDNIFYLHSDRKGRIWVGTFGGGTALSVKDSSGKMSFRALFNDRHGLNEHRCLTEDSDGRFWIGTSDGILTFHPDSILNNPTAYRTHTVSASSNSKVDIRHLMRDSRGQLWIATGNSGMAIAATTMSGDLKIVRTFTTDEGLPSNCIQASIEDRNGNVWISTENGIAMINGRDNSVESHFFSREALRNIFSEAAIVASDDGQIATGSNDGVLIFNPLNFLGQPGQHDVNMLTEPDDEEKGSSRRWATYLIILLDVVIVGVITFLLVRYGWPATRWRAKKRIPVPEPSSSPERKILTERLPRTEATPSKSADEEFLERIEAVAMANLSNAGFSMDDFASELNVGRAVFYRRLRSLLEVSPNDYLKNLRLEKAAEMLKVNPEMNVAEIADSVGFSDSLYFSKCFKGKYGLSPTSFRKNPD